MAERKPSKTAVPARASASVSQLTQQLEHHCAEFINARIRVIEEQRNQELVKALMAVHDSIHHLSKLEERRFDTMITDFSSIQTSVPKLVDVVTKLVARVGTIEAENRDLTMQNETLQKTAGDLQAEINAGSHLSNDDVAAVESEVEGAIAAGTAALPAEPITPESPVETPATPATPAEPVTPVAPTTPA